MQIQLPKMPNNIFYNYALPVQFLKHIMPLQFILPMCFTSAIATQLTDIPNNTFYQYALTIRLPIHLTNTLY